MRADIALFIMYSLKRLACVTISPTGRKFHPASPPPPQLAWSNQRCSHRREHPPNFRMHHNIIRPLPARNNPYFLSKDLHLYRQHQLLQLKIQVKAQESIESHRSKCMESIYTFFYNIPEIFGSF